MHCTNWYESMRNNERRSSLASYCTSKGVNSSPCCFVVLLSGALYPNSTSLLISMNGHLIVNLMKCWAGGRGSFMTGMEGKILLHPVVSSYNRKSLTFSGMGWSNPLELLVPISYFWKMNYQVRRGICLADTKSHDPLPQNHYPDNIFICS